MWNQQEQHNNNNNNGKAETSSSPLPWILTFPKRELDPRCSRPPFPLVPACQEDLDVYLERSDQLQRGIAEAERIRNKHEQSKPWNLVKYRWRFWCMWTMLRHFTSSPASEELNLPDDVLKTCFHFNTKKKTVYNVSIIFILIELYVSNIFIL